MEMPWAPGRFAHIIGFLDFPVVCNSFDDRNRRMNRLVTAREPEHETDGLRHRSTADEADVAMRRANSNVPDRSHTVTGQLTPG